MNKYLSTLCDVGILVAGGAGAILSLSAGGTIQAILFASLAVRSAVNLYVEYGPKPA